MIIFVIGGLCSILIWAIVIYNRLIQQRLRVQNSWSQIDVVIKNRFDLIPNLIETVHGYTKYEKETLHELTALRTQYGSATTVSDKSQLSDEMSSALNRLIVSVEQYPDLKASENYLYLKKQLSELEDKIRFSRQFFNDCVESLNTLIHTFPNNIIARLFGFREEQFFKIQESEKQLPNIKF